MFHEHHHLGESLLILRGDCNLVEAETVSLVVVVAHQLVPGGPRSVCQLIRCGLTRVQHDYDQEAAPVRDSTELFLT